jgi:hypothetical protein
MRARGAHGRGSARRGGRGTAPPAATNFPGFASTVAALAVFNTHLQGSEDALLAERERLVLRHMQSVGPPPTDFDPARLQLCETMLLEAAPCESFAAVRALPTFVAFEASFAVPPGRCSETALPPFPTLPSVPSSHPWPSCLSVGATGSR